MNEVTIIILTRSSPINQRHRKNGAQSIYVLDSLVLGEVFHKGLGPHAPRRVTVVAGSIPLLPMLAPFLAHTSLMHRLQAGIRHMTAHRMRCVAMPMQERVCLFVAPESFEDGLAG